MSLTASLMALTGCSSIGIDISPTVTATVHEIVEGCVLKTEVQASTSTEVSEIVDTPTYTLALVTLDKTTLFHYYLDVTAREEVLVGAKFLVEYNKENKKTWYLNDGKSTVTNHGYTIVGEVK